ncbi:MAG TPA: glycosyltransferase family A protein [Planctomycetota bacterium]
MPPTCDITVVIPAYNASEFIVETLDSVLAQTLPPAEIIVVDDASTDSTARILRSYGNAIRVLHTEQNSGTASIPRNIGLRAARTHFVAPCDADDPMLPQKMERYAAAMAMRPDLKVLFSDFRVFGRPTSPRASHCTLHAGFKTQLQPVGDKLYLLPRADAFNALLLENYIGASAMLLHRDAVRAVGGYDETIRAAEDIDLSLRLTEHFDFGFIDEVLQSYRLHPGSLSSNKFLHHKAIMRVLSRYTQCPIAPEARQGLRRQLADLELDLAHDCGEIGRLSEGLAHWCRALVLGGPRRTLLWPARRLVRAAAAKLGIW